MTIQCLDLVSNWSLQIDNNEENICLLGESVIPLLHPLWIPSLRASKLLESLLKSNLNLTQNPQGKSLLRNLFLFSHFCIVVCPILTKTTGLPGSLLSRSRTSQNLLSLLTTAVSQAVLRASSDKVASKGILPKPLLFEGLEILLHCSAVEESAYTIVRVRFYSTNNKHFVNSIQ